MLPLAVSRSAPFSSEALSARQLLRRELDTAEHLIPQAEVLVIVLLQDCTAVDEAEDEA